MNEIDYMDYILSRLKGKGNVLNITYICKQTNVPRKVIEKLTSGEVPTTSYQNIVVLYDFVKINNI